MPNKTTSHGLKDCLLSENTKTFWKKVSLSHALVRLICAFTDIPQYSGRKLYYAEL